MLLLQIKMSKADHVIFQQVFVVHKADQEINGGKNMSFLFFFYYFVKYSAFGVYA